MNNDPENIKIEECKDDLLTDTGYRILEKKRIKMAGIIWEFHKYDDDKWPSDPHGHNIEKKQKLDVYTGNVYDIVSRLFVRQLSKKQILYIQNELKIACFI